MIRSAICALFVGLLFLVAGCAEKSRGAQTSVRDFRAAVKSVVRLQACRRTDENLASDCVDSAIALGGSAGSVLRYFPGTKDPATGVQHYWVMSRDANGETGRPAFLGDDYGQVFEARYDPRWDQTGPDSLAKLLLLRTAVPYLRDIFACIKGQYEMDQGEFPAQLSHAQGIAGQEGCGSFSDLNSLVFEVDQGNRVGSGKFIVEYHPGETDPRRGYPTSFYLLAWPLHYGDASIRSFLVDTTGAVHFTTENRRASGADPLVFGCEAYEVYSDCWVMTAESTGTTGNSRR